jgi:gliding motility-associated-like protein
MKDLKELVINRTARIGLLFCLSFFSNTVIGQNLSAHNWYFGNSNLGIRFNRSDDQPRQVTDQNPLMGQGGAAVASDHRSGDLLFYTDGTRVFDARHLVMPNGAGLLGNNAGNQPAVISPRPTLSQQFYIFTNDAVYPAGGTIRYTLVNMNVAGNSTPPAPPLGDVDGGVKNVPTGIVNAAPGMLMIETGTGPYDYWFIAQDITSRAVTLYQVTVGGLVPVDNLPTPGNIIAANFSYHPGSGLIAVSPRNPNANIQILRFDETSRTLSYERDIPNTGFDDGANESVFDVEFSPDGFKLFISRHGGGAQPGVLYRFDLDNPFAALDPVPTPALHRSYGLQIGPDGRVYHLYQATPGGPFLLGRIENPDSNDLGTLVYTAAPLGNDNYNGRQFPATAPRRHVTFGSTGVEFFGTCLGTPTKFYPLTEPPAENFFWIFNDPNNPDPAQTISTAPAPIYEFSQPGTYSVFFIATTNGDADTVEVLVNIIQSDSVDLGQDTVICPGEVLELDAGPNGQQYLWNTGETTQTIEVDSAGYFWVVVDYGSCTSYDAINVEVYGEMNRIANVWYFGDGAGIDFNSMPPTPLTDGQLQAPAGAAAISDRNGDNLFYTDGNSVFDRNHALMEDLIGGDNLATQSSIIIPFPGDETMFYIFTTKDIWNTSGDHSYILSYSVVDIKEIDGATAGEVIVKDVPLFGRSTERLAAYQGGNGYWLLTHEFGNNNFRAYPITENGIGNPVLSSVGSSHGPGNASSGEGYMKFSPDGSRVAVALSDPPDNYVEIFDFDLTTGVLSNPIRIDLNAALAGNDQYTVYGVEFASNSNKLFVSMNNPSAPGSRLFEIKLFYTDEDSIRNNIDLMADVPGVNMGALQTGPDGQVYIALDGQGFLGNFQPNLDTLQTSTYNFDVNRFDLNGGISGLGLPNFVQNFTNQPPGPSISAQTACVGQPVSFIGTPRSIIDTYFWEFGDGGVAFEAEVEHTYDAPGDYLVELTLSNRCVPDTTLSQLITISGFPAKATIPPVGVICDGGLVLDADTLNTPGLRFLWSTGDTTRVITVDQPADYFLSIVNDAGCVTLDTIQVYDGRPQFDLGPNLTVCQDETVPPIDTQLPVGNPPNTFSWTVNGTAIPNNRGSYQPDTGTPGVFLYRVQVVDGLTGCVARDSVTLTVNANPQATYTVFPSSCGIADGSIEITSPLDNITAEWQDAGGNVLGSGSTLDNIPAGVYRLFLTQNVSGCVNDYTITVIDNNPQFTITATPVVNCDDGSIQVVVSEPGAVTYTLADLVSGQVTPGSSPTPGFTIPGLEFSTYDLLVEASNGCTNQQQNIALIRPDAVDVTIDPAFDFCGSSATVSVVFSGPTASFEWRQGAEDGPVVGNGATVTITDSDIYFIIASAAGLCDTIVSTNVNLSPNPDAAIVPLTDGCDGTRQISAESGQPGNFSYLWNTGATGPVIVIQQTDTYSVTVREQATGCQNQASLLVEVFQPFAVDIALDDQPCQDNNPVTLTASVFPVQPVTWEWLLEGAPLSETSSTLVTREEGLFQAVAFVGVCSAFGELQVVRLPVTPSDVEPEYLICPEPPADEVAVIQPGDFVVYRAFDVSTGQEIFEDQPGVFVFDQAGTYRFELLNRFNCFTRDTTRVVINCVPTIFAPNAFSPYAQLAENQTFRIYPSFVGNFEIFIFNRWGELVFYSDDLSFMVNDGWNGIMNGKELPMGTYPYVMKFTSTTNPEKGLIEQRGGITILK